MTAMGRRYGNGGAGLLSFKGLVLAILVVGWLVAPGPVHAGGDVLAATDALARAQTGDVVIVDVRTIDEWARTGVPQGALEVSLLPQWGTLNPNFVDDVLAAVGRDKDTPIALICATGRRSAYAQDLLEKNGFTAVYSISEGMAGSTYGPGWLARGLPLDRCESC